MAVSPPVVPAAKPNERTLAHGREHGMREVQHPRLANTGTFGTMLKELSETTAAGKDLGLAADVLEAMTRDKTCRLVLTLSGNATPFGPLIGDLVDRGWIHAIVTSGSVLTHSFSVERGRPQFQIEDPEAVDDNWMYEKGYNRIFDVVELEESLDEGMEILAGLMDRQNEGAVLSSAEIAKDVGDYLVSKHPNTPGFIHAAFRAKVPIFVPAFTDCEIGLCWFAHNFERETAGQPPVDFDPYADLKAYCDFARRAKTLGILTLGGGVPRNWAQQIGPLFDTLEGLELEKRPPVRFKYGVRICTAPVGEGSLSGCTYSEGRSWGKFLSEDQGGRFAEVQADYSVAFPVLVQAVAERIG
jgi:deoxyhypusine synthase